MRCLECDCWLVRDYKCPHDCDWCKDCDPETEEEPPTKAERQQHKEDEQAYLEAWRFDK